MINLVEKLQAVQDDNGSSVAPTTGTSVLQSQLQGQRSWAAPGQL